MIKVSKSYIKGCVHVFLTVGVWMSAVANGRSARLGGGGLAPPNHLLRGFFRMSSVFYFMDIVSTSVEQGSFESIGKFAITFYGVLAGVVHALVLIAQTVYDFIHFW